MRAALVLLLVGCGDEAGKAGSTHWGDLVADRAGEAASVDGLSAFGFNLSGSAVLLVVPNDAATCEDAFHTLDADPEYDPSVTTPAGACSTFVDLTGYDPAGMTATSTPDAPSTTSIIALSCAMDSGAWALEQRNTYGYFYSGPYWQGSPDDYTITASGGDEEDFTVDVEMSAFDGNFIYDSMEDAPASGSASGSVTATWCSDLSQTVYF